MREHITQSGPWSAEKPESSTAERLVPTVGGGDVRGTLERAIDAGTSAARLSGAALIRPTGSRTSTAPFKDDERAARRNRAITPNGQRSDLLGEHFLEGHYRLPSMWLTPCAGIGRLPEVYARRAKMERVKRGAGRISTAGRRNAGSGMDGTLKL